MSRTFRLLPLVALLLLAGGLALGLSGKNDKHEPTEILGKTVGSFAIPLLNGDGDFSSNTWKDKTVIVNVFASWCIPCAEEHKVLTHIAQNNQIELVGIAWKDKSDAIEEWLATRGNPYRAVGLDSKGKTTLALGISGVPETFVIDRGTIVYNYKGALTEDMADTIILPLVAQLQDHAPAAR